MFETDQEKATEMPDQKQGQDKAHIYKGHQKVAADFWNRLGFHVLMEIFSFWTEAA
jgi:hypothetical protein